MNNSFTYLSMALIRADIIAANQAIEYYSNHTLKTIKNKAAYNLQQAIEKLIKIQIYRSGAAINNHKMYTHNLVVLDAYANSLGIAYNIPKELVGMLDKITSWEADSRYNCSFSVRVDILTKVYSIVLQWYSRLYKYGIR